MLNRAVIVILTALVLAIYVAILAGKRAPWLLRTALPLNQISLIACAAALVWTTVSPPVLAGFIFQLVLQSSFLANNAVSGSGSTRSKVSRAQIANGHSEK